MSHSLRPWAVRPAAGLTRLLALLFLAVSLPASAPAAPVKGEGPTSAAAGTLGIDSFPGVTTVGESSEALCGWYRGGLRALPLVHLGAWPVFYAPDVDRERDGTALVKALEERPCGELAVRTSGYVRADSLYGEGDFALAAHALGVASELWWVVPSRKGLFAGEPEAFRPWLRDTFGLPEEFTAGLEYDGTIARGEWRGLPVYLCALNDLPAPEGPVILNVDTGFLMHLYKNPVQGGFLDLIGSFFAALRERKLQGAAVSVSSAGRGTPVAFRYLGTWVGDFLRHPKSLEKGPPESWRRQQQFEYLDFMLARDDALAEAERLAALEPASPVPWYDRALVAARRGRGEEAAGHLREAVARDHTYRRGYVELAEVLMSSRLTEEVLALLRRGWERHPGDLDIGIALANLLGRLGRAAKAADIALSLAEKEPSVPLLHLVSADALRDAGRETEAAAAMERFRKTAPSGRWREEVLENRKRLLPSQGG